MQTRMEPWKPVAKEAGSDHSRGWEACPIHGAGGCHYTQAGNRWLNTNHRGNSTSHRCCESCALAGKQEEAVARLKPRNSLFLSLRRRSRRLDIDMASTGTNKLLKLAWLWPVSAQQQDGHKDEENKERVGYDIDDGTE